MPISCSDVGTLVVFLVALALGLPLIPVSPYILLLDCPLFAVSFVAYSLAASATPPTPLRALTRAMSTVLIAISAGARIIVVHFMENTGDETPYSAWSKTFIYIALTVAAGSVLVVVVFLTGIGLSGEMRERAEGVGQSLAALVSDTYRALLRFLSHAITEIMATFGPIIGSCVGGPVVFFQELCRGGPPAAQGYELVPMRGNADEVDENGELGQRETEREQAEVAEEEEGFTLYTDLIKNELNTDFSTHTNMISSDYFPSPPSPPPPPYTISRLPRGPLLPL
ncbi:hypothetical protein JCM10213_007413 [Rhodosporidiobolus nylandii]